MTQAPTLDVRRTPMKPKQRKTLFRGAVKVLICALLLFGMTTQSAPFVTPVSAFDEGFKFRVGLVYGSSVKKSIAISSTDEYVMGFQSLIDETKSYTELGTFPAGNIYITVDGYDKNGNQTRGYNLQITTRYQSYSSALQAAQALKSKVSEYSLFVAYLNGYYCVRIGDFASQYNAELNLKTVQSRLGSSYTLEIAAPNSRIINVYNSSGYVIMEYMSTSYNLGLKVKSGYMTYNKKTYEGVLALKRYTTDSYDGVQLVSVLPIERYVMCVLPNEIIPSWPKETLRAFAITVRSYATAGLNKYDKSYSFDITGTSQVYGMASNVTEGIVNAVKDTEGLVMSYNGKVAEAFYSSSVGGVTVGSGDAYSTSYPYLKAVYTPWEKYADLSAGYHGLWTIEMTGAELLTRLRSYGYSYMKGSAITSVKVNSCGEGSTYVNSVTLTDDLGNTATVTGCDKIRIRLGLYSANFVVGKGSVSYTYDKVTTLGTDVYDGNYPAFNLNEFNVKTAVSTLVSRFTRSLKVQTGDGKVSFSSPKANVVTGKDTSNGHSVYEVTSHTATAKGASSSFVFAGKGWGHGVGLSQHGIRDLGYLGYSSEEMLNAYYTDIDIVTYSSLGIG